MKKDRKVFQSDHDNEEVVKKFKSNKKVKHKFKGYLDLSRLKDE